MGENWFGERRMSTLLTYRKNIFKVPAVGQELQVMFDVALCHHSADETFTCDRSIQIAPVWKAFLADQRGPRVLQGALCSRTLSLRSTTDKVRLAQESLDKARLKLE